MVPVVTKGGAPVGASGSSLSRRPSASYAFQLAGAGQGNGWVVLAGGIRMRQLVPPCVSIKSGSGANRSITSSIGCHSERSTGSVRTRAFAASNT
jgi:hypothetical protein